MRCENQTQTKPFESGQVADKGVQAVGIQHDRSAKARFAQFEQQFTGQRTAPAKSGADRQGIALLDRQQIVGGVIPADRDDFGRGQVDRIARIERQLNPAPPVAIPK